MDYKTKDRIATTVMLLVISFSAYLMVAGSVFHFRHPWATRTEAFLWFGKVITFQRVSYEEMRKDYK